MSNNINAEKQVEELAKAYAQLTKEVDDAVDVLKEYQKTNQKLPSEYLNSLKKLKEVQEQYNKAIAEANGKQAEYTANRKEQERLDKAILSSKAKLAQSTSKEAQELARLRFETQQQNKATREAATLSSALATEYQKLVVKMNQTARVVQNLNAKRLQGIKLSDREQAELKQSTADLAKYRNAVMGADASVGRFQRNVGNYPKAMGAAANAVRSLASAMGLMGGAFLFVQVMRDAFNRVREFDKAMQNISGIMRVSRKDIADLEAEIIRVAGSSVKTSREVAELAENLVTLGKTKEEIKDLLEPVNNLGIALETTSGEAAEFLVQTLNAFGAGTDEASRYADVIAGIRSSTSLDFQRMRDSFQYIAPISRLLGKDLEYTGAIIGVLSDNSIKAEQAGRLLATAQIKLASSNTTLDEALKEINDTIKSGANETEVLAKAGELFGAQAAKIGAILAQNIDTLGDYEERIRSSSGALEDLVGEQLESLDAQLKILDSTWEKLILSIEKGDGILSKIAKGSIQFLNSRMSELSDIIDVIDGKLSGEVLGAKIVKKLDFMIPNIWGLRDSLVAAADSTIELDEATKKYRQTVQEQSDAFVEMYGSLAPLTDEQKDLNDQIERFFELTGDEPKGDDFGTIGYFRKQIQGLQKDLENVSTRDAAKNIQDQIKNFQNKIDEILGSKVKGSKTSREKVVSLLDLIGLPTTEEAQAEFEKYGEDVLETLRENFNIDEDLLPKEITLPEIVLPLSAEKARFYRENFVFSDEEMSLIASQFDELGRLYNVDASKFTALFDQKENTIGDYVAAAGEAMKGLYNSFGQNYEDDLLRARDAADRALLFAGENSAAQAEIKEQLAEKERRIRIRQARDEKQQAIFSAIINTAAAVVKALPNIPLSVIIGALGAAEIALIASRPVPQFFVGTEDTGRGGNVDSKGGFNAILHPNERVMTKEQNKKMHGYSNERVADIIDLYHNKDLFNIELQKMLDFNGILPEKRNLPTINIESNSLSKEDYQKGVERIISTMNSSQGVHITVDENGMNKFITRNNQRTQILNNRLEVKKRYI